MISIGLFLILLGGVLLLYFRKCATLLLRNESGIKLSISKLNFYEKSKLLGYHFMTLLWLVFFTAGLGLIGSGLGFWEWFFNNVLGW